MDNISVGVVLRQQQWLLRRAAHGDSFGNRSYNDRAGALLAAQHILGGRRRDPTMTVAALLPQIWLLSHLSNGGEPNPDSAGKIQWPYKSNSLSSFPPCGSRWLAADPTPVQLKHLHHIRSGNLPHVRGGRAAP